jgi:hypothetical protein
MKAPNLKALDYGAICGVARVIGMVTKSRSKWFNQPPRGYVNYGRVLADVKRLRKPIKCKCELATLECAAEHSSLNKAPATKAHRSEN